MKEKINVDSDFFPIRATRQDAEEHSHQKGFHCRFTRPCLVAAAIIEFRSEEPHGIRANIEQQEKLVFSQV